MGKYIICDFARSDWGKSQTLLRVIDSLKKEKMLKTEELIDGYDKYAVFELNGKTIVVITQGDPDSLQEECLHNAVKQDAAIIVCASRTRGSTVDCIYKTAENGYSVIWFSNLYADDKNLPCIEHFPDIMANAIVKLIKTLTI